MPSRVDWGAALQNAAMQLPGPERRGRVVRAVGSVVRVSGLNAKVGDACEFMHPGSIWCLRGEEIVTPRHADSARHLREMLQKLQDIETLVQIGEYRAGADPLADQALASHEEMTRFLRQDIGDFTPLPVTVERLQRLVTPPSPPTAKLPTPARQSLD